MTDAMSFGVHIPFVEHLGFTLHRMEAGESELRYAARPEIGITALETSLGAQLFDRRTSGSSLTEAGQRLLEMGV